VHDKTQRRALGAEGGIP